MDDPTGAAMSHPALISSARVLLASAHQIRARNKEFNLRIHEEEDPLLELYRPCHKIMCDPAIVDYILQNGETQLRKTIIASVTMGENAPLKGNEAIILAMTQLLRIQFELNNQLIDQISQSLKDIGTMLPTPKKPEPSVPRKGKRKSRPRNAPVCQKSQSDDDDRKSCERQRRPLSEAKWSLNAKAPPFVPTGRATLRASAEPFCPVQSALSVSSQEERGESIALDANAPVFKPEHSCSSSKSSKPADSTRVKEARTKIEKESEASTTTPQLSTPPLPTQSQVVLPKITPRRRRRRKLRERPSAEGNAKSALTVGWLPSIRELPTDCDSREEVRVRKAALPTYTPPRSTIKSPNFFDALREEEEEEEEASADTTPAAPPELHSIPTNNVQGSGKPASTAEFTSPQHPRSEVLVEPTLLRRSSSQGVPQVDSSVPSLSHYIESDTKTLQQVGWKALFKQSRERSDISSLENVHHPANRLLKHYRDRGAPVKLSTEPWSRERIDRALQRGAHKSCLGYHNFLHEEFADMRAKGQWIVLRASDVKDLPGLRISPPGVVPQDGRRARTIIDYTYSGVNSETLALAAVESMQFGHALDRILREILLADPTLGPVRIIKVDLSDGFYRIDLNIDDIPKLGVVFPTEDGEEDLIAFPLVLPMGWKNSPPIFSTATETIADLANARLEANIRDEPHPFDDEAEAINPDLFKSGATEAAVQPVQEQPSPPVVSSLPSPSTPTRLVTNAKCHQSMPVPSERDPSLPFTGVPLSKIDIFVDDFVGLAQETRNSRRVRRILLHAIDDVLRPNDDKDHVHRKEPVSLKKLRQGDCSWSTIKLVLGWVIDTVNMTIHLPDKRVKRLSEILSSIPIHQKRTSVKKWHKVLGELRSMSIALPGARNLFSQMQLALANKVGGRVALTKGVHQAIEDFRWILNDITSRPTRIAELVPLLASALGHHDASGAGAGGIWFPAATLQHREGYEHKPVVWRFEWPDFIMDRLVTSQNPNGTITNSDLELAGGLLHLEALAQTFDIRERTVLSKTDNLNTLFWERKGSATTDRVPAHLLRLFGIHQRYHRYVPRHDYLSGPSNPIADALSRDFHLAWKEMMESLGEYLPNQQPCQVWEPSQSVVDAVIDALLRKPVPPTKILKEPAQPAPRLVCSDEAPTLEWAGSPFAKGSRTKLGVFTKSPDEFLKSDLVQPSIPSSLGKLKVTYGSIKRRPPVWGPSSS